MWKRRSAEGAAQHRKHGLSPVIDLENKKYGRESKEEETSLSLFWHVRLSDLM